MQMFDFISCVVLYRFVYQPRLTYLFCVVNWQREFGLERS